MTIAVATTQVYWLEFGKIVSFPSVSFSGWVFLVVVDVMPQSSRLGSLVQGEGHHVGTHTIGAHDNLISKRNFLGGTDPPPPLAKALLGL